MWTTEVPENGSDLSVHHVTTFMCNINALKWALCTVNGCKTVLNVSVNAVVFVQNVGHCSIMFQQKGT